MNQTRKGGAPQPSEKDKVKISSMSEGCPIRRVKSDPPARKQKSKTKAEEKDPPFHKSKPKEWGTPTLGKRQSQNRLGTLRVVHPPLADLSILKNLYKKYCGMG
jgi:hypothetical protein